MPSVASVHPLWPITLRSLRELTRLAVAALVLAVGLGSATAAPSPALAAPTGSAVAQVRAGDPLPHRERLTERVVDAATPPPTVRPTDAPVVAAAPAARPDRPAAAPGRGDPARRGPPTA